MTDITIPAAALEAGAKAAYAQWVSFCVTSGGVPEEYRTWAEIEDVGQEEWLDQTRAAFLAMIEAWPRVFEQQFYELTADGKRITFPVIVLPLPQEASDDKA
jgi:hypothetical protein